jgi:hypothetical protein
VEQYGKHDEFYSEHSLNFILYFSRDGDVVPVRISSDGSTLNLTDLHEPDAEKATTPTVPTHNNSPKDEHY